MPFDLFDNKCGRCLEQDERQQFEQAAEDREREVRTFYLMLLIPDAEFLQGVTCIRLLAHPKSSIFRN